MAVAWAKEYHLVKKEVKWYKERWTRGHDLENARANDLILEDKEKKYIWICDMACPQEIKIEEKKNEK